MLEILTAEQWSPYIAGAGIGVLSWISFAFANKPLGCSTSYFRIFGMIRSIFRKGKKEENPYYEKFTPVIDWQVMLVLGIIIGAFISAWTSGAFAISMVPDLFASRFGDNALLRAVIAVAGGLLLGFGARFAGGCTSGHGISGITQLNITSILTVMFMFAGGIATAFIIYGVT